jgi:F-type H+-transporting ATPase subunit b
MNRDHWIARSVSFTTAAVVFSAAAVAQASEEGLVLLPDPVLLPLLVVLFGAMVFPVNALILKPIFRVLDEREDKIAGTRRRAEKLTADAEQILERYEQAVREARQDAESDRKQTLVEARRTVLGTTTSARGEAEDRVNRAREEMASALAEARSVLRSQSQDLAREIASRALGRALS